MSPLLLAVFLGGASLAGDAPDPAAIEFFEAKVRPLLADQCLSCHGPEKQKAGLRLDSRSALLEGGDSGPAVKPGDPDASRLLEVIRYDADVQMPPKRKLSDAEIAAVRDWIKAGAAWPDAGQAAVRAPVSASVTTAKVSEEDRAFWSFRPVRDVAPPEVRDASWPASTIDRFILARLEEAGLRPNEPADRRTWLRRVSFDLIGLPPAPEEVEAFLADDSPLAFSKVVDRLLASPRYGERWARHWLDVARYGEDQAHTFEARLYPFGYRYRDWVVKALNGDLPYDRFVVEQIAGDLLDGPDLDDRRAATGLFSLGPVYYGKAVYDELDDRVDTLTRGFLGLTVACARCHDHKFDPISQRDYYALAGIFSSTIYKEYPKAPPEAVARYEQGQAAIKEKTDDIAAFLKEESRRWSERATEQTAKYVVAAWTLHNQRKVDPKRSAGPVAKADGLDAPSILRWEKYLFGEGSEKRPHLTAWNRLIAGQPSDKDLSEDGSAKSEAVKAAEAIQSYLVSSLSLQNALRRQKTAQMALGLGDAGLPDLPMTAKAALDESIAPGGLFALVKDEVESKLPDDAKKTLKEKKTELARLKKEVPAKPPVIHALAESPTAADMKVFLRGNPSTPGEVAPRRPIEVASSPDSRPFEKGSGRLELARWIASPDNPLTARVIVNRVWAQHFGRGLVPTPSNFGHMGEPPTHPELLDHLAARFMASGWSLKGLHREIVLSRTYGQTASADSASLAADPENRLYGRANRRRLEVEAWRDALLAVTGELDTALGGPSADLGSDANRRRTLYGAVSRHNLDSLLRLFDFPDPNLTSDRRPITTVPLQQLFVLNSPFMERRAKALARRLEAEAGTDDDHRIDRAFALLFGRPASDRERRMALDYLRASGASPERLAQALLGTSEFLYID